MNTALQQFRLWYREYVDTYGNKPSGYEVSGKINELLSVEESQIKDAIMYSLDEDGHTGEWKIKFANKYYNDRFQNSK